MNDDSKYRNLPDFQFRSQYDATPRPDKDVEAALRGEFDKPEDQAVGFDPGVQWISPSAHRIR